MNRLTKIALSILSGALLSCAWPEHGFPLLLFVGFIPLLLVENDLFNKKKEVNSFSVFWYAAIAFSIWNSFTTFWIYNAALVGVVAAVIINTLLTSFAFYLFHVTHRVLAGKATAYVALIGYWLSYEFLQLNWDLNWPWLNLGNGFASYPSWIQWYEYTGIFGGSLWVLVVNILLFHFIYQRFFQKICSRAVGMKLGIAVILTVIPIIYSYYIYRGYKEVKSSIDVIVVQPNLDPYSEQYSVDPQMVTAQMLASAKIKADSLADFIVFPESAIQEHAWEDQLDSLSSVRQIRAFNKQYPLMKAVVGMSTYKIFNTGEPLTISARKFSDADKYYDAYNTALYVANNGSLQKHHKSKLTPGVEKMPYPRLFKFLEKFALDLGGTVGTLGSDAEQIPFMINDSLKIAPVICYESVYGEFVNEFVSRGANAIFVITNDGWWGNTPGHRQHLLFSVLRAIETRRSVARSANTGVSCFINQRGDISQRTDYWVPAAIRSKMNTNSEITFYVKHGDYIGRFFLVIAGLMFILTLGIGVFRKT
ncbi:MAG: apolipoprotein N-acyltransferase [Bacteroidetes bacterium]|nr:apolipoprotein N-acyltransferase [Bacteroidota bacterium]